MQVQLRRTRKTALKTGQALLILSIYILGLLSLFLLSLGQGFSETAGLTFYTITVTLILVLFPLSLALMLWARQRLTPLIITGLLITCASALIFLVPVFTTAYKSCQSKVTIILSESIGYHITRIGFHYLLDYQGFCNPTII